MADDPDYRYSVNEYTGDGSQTNWEVSFSGGYISKDHVSVRVTNAATADITEPTFTWVNDYTIQIVPAVALGDTLKIYRNTPKDAPIVDYNDGSIINERNLDTGEKQAIFAIAEMADAFGTVPDREALNEAIAQAQAIIDQLNQQKDRAPLNVADYATSEQWALIKAGAVSVHSVLGAAMIAASIQGRPLLLSGSQDFIWNGPEIANPGVHLMGDGSKITKVGAGNMFATRWTRPALTAGLLTANVVKGSDTVNVPALEAGNYVAGKWCLLTDLTLLRGTNNQFQGEFVRIRSITGSEVKLWGPTDFTYATSANARLVPVDNLLVPGVRYSDLHIVMDSTANPESEQTTFTLEGCINPVMQNVTVDRPIRPVVDLRNCINALIDAPRFNVGGSTISGGASASPGEYLPGFSYGVMERGLNLGLIMQGGHADNLRHMYTTVAIAQSDATPYGDPSNSLIIGSVHDNAANAAFDTHEAGRNITFLGCKAFNARYMGFQIRSKATRVIGCEVNGAIGPGIWNRGANNPTNTSGVHANYCIYENNKLVNTNQGTTFDGNDWTAWGAFMDEGSFTVCNRLHVEDAGGSAVMAYRNGGNLNGSFTNTFARNINTKSVANKHAFRIVGNLGASGNYRINGLEVIDPNGYTVDLLQVSSIDGSVIARGIEGRGFTGSRIGVSAGAAINDDQYMTSLTVERSNDRGQYLSFRSDANGHLLSAYGNNAANAKSMFMDLHVTPDDLPPTSGIVEVGFRINGAKGLNWDSSGNVKVNSKIIANSSGLVADDDDITSITSVKPPNTRSIIMNRGPTFSWKAGETVTETTAKFAAFLAQAASYGGGRGMAGEFLMNPSTFDASATLEFDEGAILNFNTGSYTTPSMSLGNDTVTLLPTFSDLLAGASTVVFSAAHGLVPGDWFIIQNPTDFSWHYGQDYYRAGEWCRVAGVSGLTVTLDQKLLYGYTGAVCIAGRPTLRKIRLVGGTWIGNIGNRTPVIRATNLLDSKIDVTAKNGRRAGVDLFRSCSSEVTLKMADYTAADGLNYGVSFIACMLSRTTNSDIRSERHAVTYTGGNIPFTVPNRYCYVEGSSLTGGFFAYDSHAAAEFCGVRDSVLRGGAQLGGGQSLLDNCDVFNNTHPVDQVGVAIRHRERTDMNTKITNTRVYLDTAIDNSLGAIHLAEASSIPSSGQVVFDVDIQASVDIRNAVWLALTGTVGNVGVSGRVSWSGKGVGLTPPVVRLLAGTTAGFGTVDLNLANVSPRFSASGDGYKAKYTRIAGSVNATSINTAPNINFTAAGVLDLTGFSSRNSGGAGITVSATANTLDVEVNVQGGTFLNNSQDVANTGNNRSSIYLSAIKKATIVGAVVGDTQTVNTQVYGIAAVNCADVDVQSPLHNGPINDLTTGTTRYAVTGRKAGVSVIGTASSVTATVATYFPTILYTAAIGANYTVGLSTTGAGIGDRFKVVRTAASTGAFSVTVAGVKALAVGQYAEFIFDGTAWQLIDFGSL